MADFDSSNLWPGWETVRLLGRGSFGAVYEICRRIGGTEERAAVKCLSIPQSRSEIDELRLSGYDEASITRHFGSLKDKLVREYSTMVRLKGSANVVYCDDIRTRKHENDVGWDVFIKMELLRPLMTAMSGGMEEMEILRLGRDIAAALVSCHREKIVHRDVKPQNIFVNREGIYKLGDFGVARTMEGTGSASVRTGTYRYMAPEVYNGLHYGALADLYSLGLVLYWLLNNGRAPFIPAPPQLPTGEDEERARFRRFRGDPLPPPAHGSAPLKRIVLKACAFAPRDRYPNAEALREALEELLLLEMQRGPLPEAPAEEPAPAPVPEEKPERRPEPVRQTEPVRRPEPVRQTEPVRRPEPVRPTEPVRRKKRKTKRKLLLACILLLAVLLGAALYLLQDRSQGGLSWKYEEGTLTISGSGDMQDFAYRQAPWSEVEGVTRVVVEKGVTRIGANAFSSCEMTAVSLPEGLLSIGDGAFEGCSRLTAVSLPQSLTAIGERAFYDCGILSAVSIPAGVTDIGSGAFSACGLQTIEVDENNPGYRSRDGVLFSRDGAVLLCYPKERSGVSYQIPEGVSAVGDYAFSKSDRLSVVGMPESLTEIGKKSFERCSALSGLELPGSLRSIGTLAFYNCKSLSSVTIPAGVTDIGYGAFSACGLSAIEVREGNPAFLSADGVLFSRDGKVLLCYPAAKTETEYTVPYGVTNIEDYAFCNCGQLTAISLPDGAVRIGTYSFYCCRALETLTLPESLNTIGENAFSNCDCLCQVYFTGSANQWAGISLGDGNEALTRGAVDFNASRPGSAG